MTLEIPVQRDTHLQIARKRYTKQSDISVRNVCMHPCIVPEFLLQRYLTSVPYEKFLTKSLHLVTALDTNIGQLLHTA